MNTPAKLLVTLLVVFLFVSVQCKDSLDKALKSFHVTLPEPGQYTQEYKITMKKDQKLKFTFTHPETTYASCHFDQNTAEVFAVKHNQVVKVDKKRVLVFKLYNKATENAGKPETLTIMGAKTGPHISADDIMAHKKYLLVPLYVGMAFTGIASAAIMVIAFMCVARILIGSSRRESIKQVHLPVYASYADSVHYASPAVYAQPVKPVYPSTSHYPTYPAQYYIHTERTPLISSMYPTVPSAGNIQGVDSGKQQ